MIRTILLFIAVSFLFSCISVEFKEPQPASVKNLKSFPTKIIGTYLTVDDDTVIIGKDFFISESLNIELENGQNSKTKISLSDEVVLKKIKSFYVLNLKGKENWSVVLFKYKKNNVTSYTFNANEYEFLKSLQSITKTELIRNEDEKLRTIVVAPTKKEFIKIVKNDSLFEKSVLRKIH